MNQKDLLSAAKNHFKERLPGKFYTKKINHNEATYFSFNNIYSYHKQGKYKLTILLTMLLFSLNM